MGIDEIKNLNTKEKLILINDIWDSLEKEEANIESPKWHENIIKERLDKVRNKKVKYISLEELKNR